MPGPKNNAKATGDTHLPDIEDEDGAPASAANTAGPADTALARDLADEGRPGQGINQAGFLKDQDGAVGKDKP
ncbi:MAG TPA: hypothetical protein VIL30_02200 [Ramlibacter sp.]|jgi:hypothetical protein